MDAAKSLQQSTGLPLAAYRVSYKLDRIAFHPYDRETVDALLDKRREDKALEISCKPRA